ncbi:MAG TPA: OsmC family protein [Candidatus Acidoferrum sp.]|nr:OsmC family protein [Candidatus Acidoferrum sp.]
MAATRSAVARRRQGYQHDIEIRDHRLIADEPEDEGGDDAGPRPTELLAASLASCTAMTIEMYADRKGWDLGKVEVTVQYEVPSTETPPKFDVTIRTPLQDALTDEQRERILVIAGKCPVHRTLKAQDVEITDSLEMFEE